MKNGSRVSGVLQKVKGDFQEGVENNNNYRCFWFNICRRIKHDIEGYSNISGNTIIGNKGGTKGNQYNAHDPSTTLWYSNLGNRCNTFKDKIPRILRRTLGFFVGL